jgi:NAD+ synthase (glutamine-hydrolysing)
MRICVAQINSTVGAIFDNLSHIERVIAIAEKESAEIVVFPECAISGFPIGDLVYHEGFLDDCQKALKAIAPMTKKTQVIVGSPTRLGHGVYSTAILFSEGREIGRHYGRNFLGAPSPGTFDLWKLGPYRIQLCVGELPELLDEDAGIVIHMSSDPWAAGSRDEKLLNFCRHAKAAKTHFLHINQIGGNDGLIFDGGSVLCDPGGKIVWQADQFRETIGYTDTPTLHTYMFPMEEVRQALLLGITDFTRKQHYDDLLIGISGGIDSAVVATLATQAVGKEHVKALFLPSPFTTQESVEGATQLANNLGIQMVTIPIDTIIEANTKLLTSAQLRLQGVAFENVQSRIRSVLLMAVANTEKRLLLATGNKSEFSLGYSTLYGDLCGALAPIGDLLKTEVYHLAQLLNSKTAVIPEIILTRAPSAELAPHQKDSDDLPEYSSLDPVLSSFIAQGSSPDQITSTTIPIACVQNMYQRIWRAEFKRRQAACILKVTSACFGYDRRYPIANGYCFS